MKHTRLILLLLLIQCAACLTGYSQTDKSNPHAEGFDLAGSDAKAIELADGAMKAMGGRKAWDNTHFISWNFFGNRRLIWDKWRGNVRIDNLKNDQTVILNIFTDKGRVFKNGAELTDADSVAKYVKQGKGAWINDSYWLVMPFKLKDSGVTLKYLGEENTQENKPADVIQMTFKSVGNTPDNKYKVWIDKNTHLVSQWAYYPKFTDEKPGFVRPWGDYQRHGQILLGGDRGDRDITDIMVFTGLPGEVFTDFPRTDLTRYPQAK